MYSMLPSQVDYLNWMHSGSPLPFQYWMMLAGRGQIPIQNGVSVPTQREMANNPDLDQNLYQQAAPVTSQPVGNDPTRRVTQQEYDLMLQQQKALQQKAYEEYKRRKR